MGEFPTSDRVETPVTLVVIGTLDILSFLFRYKTTARDTENLVKRETILWRNIMKQSDLVVVGVVIILLTTNSCKCLFQGPLPVDNVPSDRTTEGSVHKERYYFRGPWSQSGSQSLYVFENSHGLSSTSYYSSDGYNSNFPFHRKCSTRNRSRTVHVRICLTCLRLNCLSTNRSLFPLQITPVGY